MKLMYEQGDLVELARFGVAPENDDDRVYGTILEVFPPIDHFVPRYRVRFPHSLLGQAATGVIKLIPNLSVF